MFDSAEIERLLLFTPSACDRVLDAIMLIRLRSPSVVASTSDSFSRHHRQPPEWQYRQATCQRYPSSTSSPPSGHARSFCRKREMMNSVDWNEREHGSRYDRRSANLSLAAVTKSRSHPSSQRNTTMCRLYHQYLRRNNLQDRNGRNRSREEQQDQG